MLNKTKKIIKTSIFLALTLSMSAGEGSFECNSGIQYTSGSSAYPKYTSIAMYLTHLSLSASIPLYGTSTSATQDEYLFLFKAKKEMIEGVPTYVFKPNVLKNNSKVMYIHGGAFIKAINPLEVKMIQDISNRSGSEVYVPLYTLADNAVFPYQLNEMYDVYQNLSNRYDASNMVLIGDSAGGTLVFNLMQKLQDNGESQPSKSIVISPVMDLALDNKDIPIYDKRDFFLSKGFMDVAMKKYMGSSYNSHTLNNPLVSPLYMNNLDSLAPTLYITGNREILHPDAIKFKRKARSYGMDLTFITIKNGFHVLPAIPSQIIEESNIARSQIASFINCK